MRILKYKNDGITAMTANKILTQISNNLYCYEEIDDYDNITYYYYIKCNNGICYPLMRSRYELTARDIEQLKDYNEQDILQNMAQREEKGKFINNIDILFCNLLGLPELVKHYTEYRELYIKMLEQERKEEQKRKGSEQVKQEQEKQKALEQLQKAEQDFKNNKEITPANFKNLCKKYNITIPIKVLGWLDQHCGYISAKKWDNEQLLKQYGYIPNFTTNYDIKYYCHKGHNSTSIASLIDKLATAMNI